MCNGGNGECVDSREAAIVWTSEKNIGWDILRRAMDVEVNAKNPHGRPERAWE